MWDEREVFSDRELEQIVNRLAWEGVDAEEEAHRTYGIDCEDIPRLMKMNGYVWDSDQEVWASTRVVWSE